MAIWQSNKTNPLVRSRFCKRKLWRYARLYACDLYLRFLRGCDGKGNGAAGLALAEAPCVVRKGKVRGFIRFTAEEVVFSLQENLLCKDTTVQWSKLCPFSVSTGAFRV